MALAILGGTGKEGQGLALRWARAGRDIVLGSRNASKGRDIAQTLNETLATQHIRGTCNRDAAAASPDVVVSTLPDSGHIDILRDIRSELDGKILVVATIAWPPGPTSEPSAAELAQDALGSGVRVVAAFQTVSAGTLRRTDTEPEDVLICGDNADAREATLSLVDETGLRGVHAGGLKQARIAEAITGALLKINKHYGVKSTGIRITGIG